MCKFMRDWVKRCIQGTSDQLSLEAKIARGQIRGLGEGVGVQKPTIFPV
ncbi:hypothetical protein SAMN05660479_00079 [Microbulbifer thermotolerans]|nr:hypothetical protein SAMN05660479_00079 [Microbulbifer thermotolerans]